MKGKIGKMAMAKKCVTVHLLFASSLASIDVSRTIVQAAKIQFSHLEALHGGNLMAMLALHPKISGMSTCHEVRQMR